MMKTMTCQQLGGACEEKFSAATFDEVLTLSRLHEVEMLKKGDDAHRDAMHKMKKLIKSLESMNMWMQSKRKEFDKLSEDK
jgi:hypothetical protein